MMYRILNKLKNLFFDDKFNPYSRGYFLSFDGKTSAVSRIRLQI